MIKEITTEDLRKMNGREGLIIQSYGQDANGFLKDINNTFKKHGVLQEGSRFEDASVFEIDGRKCLFIEFKNDMKINFYRIALWRIYTLNAFGGIWLSDYVTNQLGGFDETMEEVSDGWCGMNMREMNL